VARRCRSGRRFTCVGASNATSTSVAPRSPCWPGAVRSIDGRRSNLLARPVMLAAAPVLVANSPDKRRFGWTVHTTPFSHPLCDNSAPTRYQISPSWHAGASRAVGLASGAGTVSAVRDARPPARGHRPHRTRRRAAPGREADRRLMLRVLEPMSLAWCPRNAARTPDEPAGRRRASRCPSPRSR
jgi:hypothetical protein